MTLFISDINEIKSINKKSALRYLGAAVFCLVLGIVYECFSNGVYSVFMLGAFAIPLFGGALPFLVLCRSDVTCTALLGRYLYHSGIATLTVGSILQGVLEIYGTTNSLIKYYWTFGFVFLICGIIFFFVEQAVKKKQ